MRLLRAISAVPAGIATTFVLIAMIQWIGHTLFPPPAGLEKMSYEELRAVLLSAPAVVFLPVLLAYIVGTFAGGFVAAGLAPGARVVCALGIGLLFTLAGLFNALVMPQPLWVSVISVLCFLPAALLGAKLAIWLWPSETRAVTIQSPAPTIA